MFLRSTASNRPVFHKALTMPARHCAQCLLVLPSMELVSEVSVVFLRGQFAQLFVDCPHRAAHGSVGY